VLLDDDDSRRFLLGCAVQQQPGSMMKLDESTEEQDEKAGSRQAFLPSSKECRIGNCDSSQPSRRVLDVSFFVNTVASYWRASSCGRSAPSPTKRAAKRQIGAR
jgi:hypothetical protein